MRNSLKKLTLGVLVLAMAGLSWASGAFEGIVAYQMSYDGQTMDTEYMVKGKKLRSEMESSGMKMSTIIDMSGKKMKTTMLMHKQKMYSTNVAEIPTPGKKDDMSKEKFYKASGSKTILGHKCEHWIYEGKSGKGDIWAATGLGSFAIMGAEKSGSGSSEGWIKSMKAKGMFLLEMDFTGKDGKTMTMTATKVERKSLSASLFVIPAGYKKMPGMGDMGKPGKRPSTEDMLKGMKPELPF